MTSRPDAFVTVHTPPGRGGIAVVAITGSDAEAIVADAFEPVSTSQAVPTGCLRLGKLVDDGEVIDEVVLASRADGFEVGLHGGPAAVRRCLDLFSRLGAAVLPCGEGPPAFEPAHPKWNNAAVGSEMLRCLPAARSPLVVSALTQQWSAGLSRLASSRPAADALRKAAARLDAMVRLLAPPEVVIAGPPNAGKSQLTNALVGRTVSIVHDTAGTTRDWVREIALLDGVPIWLTDTAGLWHTTDAVDAEAVSRARRCIAEADLVILLAEGTVPQRPCWLEAQRVLKVSTKCDLCRPAGKPDATVSTVTGEGLEDLAGAIVKLLGLAGFDPAEPAAFTERQAGLLTAAACAMESSNQPEASQALRKLLAD